MEHCLLDFSQQEDKTRIRKILWIEPCYSSPQRSETQMFGGVLWFLQVFWGQNPELQFFLCSQMRAASQSVPCKERGPVSSIVAIWKQRRICWNTLFKAFLISLFGTWAVQSRVSRQSCMEIEPLKESHCQLSTCIDKGSLESFKENCT